jgi:hypothetical protein
LGKHKRVFSEPKYEINLESKDQVLIRQERQSPLGSLVKKLALSITIVLAVLFLGGLIFNMFSFSFYPTQVLLTMLHNTDYERLAVDELQDVNIYLDGKKSLKTRITPSGLSFKYRKRGQHIIGIENTASRYDSLVFVKERAMLDSLGLFNQKHPAQKILDDYVFHKLISDDQIKFSRLLSFKTRQPQVHLGTIFLSHNKQSSIILGEVTYGKNMTNAPSLAQDVLGSLYKNVLKFSPHVDAFPDDDLRIELPPFNPLNWYSDENRSHRFLYADRVNRKLTSSIFILPTIYKDPKGNVLANLVLAFAAIGDITFDPIEIKKIQLGEIETFSANSAVFSIIQAYLSMYDSFIYTGSLDDSMVDAFIQICNETPLADHVARLGNRVMRSAPAPRTNSIVYTLDEFFAAIEKMDCLALYTELSDFWVNDPYQLQAIEDFDRQEKEVVRAIIKWSLALKENEHECAENDWPSNEQRLSFFKTIKKVIDTTRSLSWLQGDALYGVLIIEINKLETS